MHFLATVKFKNLPGRKRILKSTAANMGSVAGCLYSVRPGYSNDYDDSSNMSFGQ